MPDINQKKLVKHRWLTVALAAVCLFGRLADAEAPPYEYESPNGSGVVYDKPTGLFWQQAPDPMGRSWTDASNYCRSLNTQSTKWDLPTIHELQTLVDVRTTQSGVATIDAAFFPSAEADIYWSRTPKFGAPGSVWGVDFSSGQTRAYNSGAMTALARCVHK